MFLQKTKRRRKRNKNEKLMVIQLAISGKIAVRSESFPSLQCFHWLMLDKFICRF